MTKVLITGSEGFVGRALVQSAPQDVMLARLDSAVPNNRDGAFWHGTVQGCLDSALNEFHADTIIHCAANVGGRAGINNGRRWQTENFVTDAALFEAAISHKCVKRVVYFSSSAVYPTIYQTPPVGELLRESYFVPNSAQNRWPDSTYGLAKAHGEELAEQARAEGVEVVVLRPFSGYGPGQTEQYPMPALVRRALKHPNGRPFGVFGNPKSVRDWIFIGDIVTDVWMAAIGAREPVTVNMGTGRETSFEDLVTIIFTMLGRPVPPIETIDGPEGVFWRQSDPRAYFSWRGHDIVVPLEVGVQSVINHEASR